MKDEYCMQTASMVMIMIGQSDNTTVLVIERTLNGKLDIENLTRTDKIQTKLVEVVVRSY